MTGLDTDTGQSGLRRGRAQLRHAYQDQQVAADYLDRRFCRPVGALLHRRQLAAVRHVMVSERPRRVLELAPGPARLTAELASHLSHIGVALEASTAMLLQSRGRLALAANGEAWKLVQGDAFALPFDAPFQLVYSFRFIRHFERDDRFLLYDSIRRLLEPGGWFLFDAVNEEVSAGLRSEAPRDRFTIFDVLYRREELLEELDKAGFDDVLLTGVQYRFRAQRAVQNLLAPRSQRIAAAVVACLDRMGGEPLEWIVACRRG